jgi:hypothetical protein
MYSITLAVPVGVIVPGLMDTRIHPEVSHTANDDKARTTTENRESTGNAVQRPWCRDDDYMRIADAPRDDAR